MEKVPDQVYRGGGGVRGRSVEKTGGEDILRSQKGDNGAGRKKLVRGTLEVTVRPEAHPGSTAFIPEEKCSYRGSWHGTFPLCSRVSSDR